MFCLIRFSLFGGKQKGSVQADIFAGVDLYNPPYQVSPTRSPDAFNIIRDTVGTVRKRMGYSLLAEYGERINGVFTFKGNRIVHAGTKLYRTVCGGTPELIYSDIADTKSTFVPCGQYLFIADGKQLLRYMCSDTAYELIPVSQEAYVPVLIISRDPSGNDAVLHCDERGNSVGGGGTVLEPLNLIGNAWTEHFLSDGVSTVYRLTATELDSVSAVYVENSDGIPTLVTEGYTVDKKNGTVTFETPPQKPLVDGRDNVYITASKRREGYAERINGCTVGTVCGANGSENVLVLGGSDRFRAIDYYSAPDNYTYFPDTNYSVLASECMTVNGYARMGTSLVTFLKSIDGEESGTAVIRNGIYTDSGIAFTVADRLYGDAAVSHHCIASVDGSPLFLTRSGVFAITAYEADGAKFTQRRSLYIDSVLKTLSSPSDAVCTLYDGFCVIAADSKLFLLDTLQKSSSRDVPESSYQYECYICGDMEARVIWTEENALCFGDSNGNIYAFFTDKNAPESYSDCGMPYKAYWETCGIDGGTFYKSKNFTALAVRIAAHAVTGVKVYACMRGIWGKAPVLDSYGKARYLDFSFIDFLKFTFSADRTPRTLFTKLWLKRVDTLRFRIENNSLNEPFGLHSFAVEYSVGGNYKR